MKDFKKVIAIILCIALCAAVLCGCSSKKADANANANANTETKIDNASKLPKAKLDAINDVLEVAKYVTSPDAIKTAEELYVSGKRQ